MLSGGLLGLRDLVNGVLFSCCDVGGEAIATNYESTANNYDTHVIAPFSWLTNNNALQTPSFSLFN